MTDYRKSPDVAPWSRDLDLGDILTDAQANGIDSTRLADFGLELVTNLTGGARVVKFKGYTTVTGAWRAA